MPTSDKGPYAVLPLLQLLIAVLLTFSYYNLADL